MNICKFKYIAFILISAVVYTAYGQELLKNNSWEKLKGNAPVNWRFFNYNNQSVIKIASEKFQDNKVAVISSDDIQGRGYIGQYGKVQIPAGKNIVVSGYYRTENIALGTKGMLRVDIAYNYASKDKKNPQKNQAILLKPSKEWQKFEAVSTVNSPVKNFNALFMLYRACGKVYFSGLSLKVQENGCKISPREKYVWREAENISKHGSVSDWGKETKGYYSGKGGLILKKESFKWNFRINDEVDPDTLMPIKRNYFVWLRMYGYMDRPAVSVFFGKKQISSFKTLANEKINSQNEYAGPGKYYWQKAGAFKTAGGNVLLKVVPQGRMLLDAIVVTTDSKYAPSGYEVRENATENFFTDIYVSHAMKSIYRVYGISDKVTTPLVFSYQGKILRIPNDRKPAVFNILLPESIKVKNISSVWAGKTWNIPARWGKKYLDWKNTGMVSFAGNKYNRYEIYLYNLALYYTVFVESEKADFAPGRKLSCRYYLEYKGKKQLEETVPLLTVDLKPVKAFKKIMIGPAGGNWRGFYQEFPGLADDMSFRGMNVINPWHLDTNCSEKLWKTLRDQCKQNKITILGAHSPFYGSFAVKDKRFQAVSLSGKSLGRKRPALSVNEECMAFRKNTDYLENQCKQGITGMVLDDENFNQKKDEFDYNPLTKDKFKKYIENRGLTYIDPVLIVKDKKKYAEQYKVWVDFRCDCMVEIYRKFRAAYLKGLAAAPGSSTFGRKLFVAQILKNRTPEESKENSYWDYKKLAGVCDYISPMIYTYQGIKDSAQVGDVTEMYNRYIGRKAVTPTLLCEHRGFGNVDMTQKKMFKYQTLECLMQQSKMILFWYGSSVCNPVNSQYISEAIRWAAPYEDIILDGKEYTGASSPQQWVRIKGLKLDKRILLYVANYRNPTDKKVEIHLPGEVRSILEVGKGKLISFNKGNSNNSFVTGFKSDRGKLFLISK